MRELCAAVLTAGQGKRVRSKLIKVLHPLAGEPMLSPYNFILHTAPFDGRFSTPHEYYHWHFEIMPTLTKVAAFEWGTGFFINPMPPEEAARFLREAEL